MRKKYGRLPWLATVLATALVGLAGTASEALAVSPPTVTTEAATEVIEGGAKLNGLVNPNGSATIALFKYGTTTSYGSKTAEQEVGSGKAAVAVNAKLTGLLPSTTYHYTIIGENAGGLSHGEDKTFTTPAGWLIQTTLNPDPGSLANALTDVSCTSATACMAVGNYKSIGSQSPLAESWNGTEWATKLPVAPTGVYESRLNSVSCTSSTACIAVGFDRIAFNGKSEPLAESWNGTEWSLQSPVNPAGSESTTLEGVSCTSSTACTATGTYFNTATTSVTLAERWNGTEWKVQTTPNPVGPELNTLQGVSCTSATACTAVGSSRTGSVKRATLAESWNGTEWSIKATPALTGSTGNGNLLTDVSCTSATACTAVGSNTVTAGTQTVAERWNGTEWKVQTTPNPSGAVASLLNGVSCASATVCTATGEFRTVSGGATSTLAEQWNGTEWKVQTTPNSVGAKSSFLGGVSCTAAEECTAVGRSIGTGGSEPTKTLAERYL